MISIITSVYNNNKYLKEALDSFIESCEGYDYEILVGIDNCEISLEHVLDIYPLLNKNIKIFYFTDKVGTYIIRNTLAYNANTSNLIFFDSDDVMRKNTVKNTLESFKKGSQYHRFGFIPFSGILKYSKSENLKVKFSHHFGAFGIKKEIFLEMNGFEPWICAADGEFFWRITSNMYKISLSKDVDILYRRHENNLTSGNITGMQSPLRKEYHKKKEIKIKNNQNKPLPNLVTSNFVIIDYHQHKKFVNEGLDSLKIINKQLSIIIPTFNTPIFLDECLESIINSIGTVNVEILVGIDNCKLSLDHVQKKKYDHRIKFYFFKENNGPYIIKNSLVKITKSDIILFFDSDDLMSIGLIEETLDSMKKYKMYKPKYFDFKNKNEISQIDKLTSNKFGEGVFAIDKTTFMSLNGFEGWRCAADSDFMGRFYKRNIPFSHGQKISFFRRIHEKSLTNSPETNMSSKLRAHYVGLSKTNIPNGKCLEFKTSEFVCLSTQTFKSNFEIIKNKPEPIMTSSNILKKIRGTNPQQQTNSNGVDYDKLNKILYSQGVYDPKKNTDKPKIVQNKPIDRNKLIEIKKGSNLDALKKNLPGKPDRRKDTQNIFSKKNSR